jgi:hypothetical protein
MNAKGFTYLSLKLIPQKPFPTFNEMYAAMLQQIADVKDREYNAPYYAAQNAYEK